MIAQFFSVELAAVIPIVIVALGVFSIVALVSGRRDPDPAGTRPYAVYLVLIIFFSMFTALFALTSAAAALYAIFRIAAPGYSDQLATTSVERDAGVVQLVSAGFLALGSWAIFRYHWRRTRTLRGDTPIPPGDRERPPGSSRPKHAGP